MVQDRSRWKNGQRRNIPPGEGSAEITACSIPSRPRAYETWIARCAGTPGDEDERHFVTIIALLIESLATRKAVREMIEPVGGFILIHVATSIEVCEQRDRKGLYAKARAGILKEFTGISDPYEVPEKADMVIDTGALSAEEAAQEIVLHLEREGYIGVSDDQQG